MASMAKNLNRFKADHGLLPGRCAGKSGIGGNYFKMSAQKQMLQLDVSFGSDLHIVSMTHSLAFMA